MRRNKTVVLGAAALCVGMLGFAGCNNQVMGQREYVPATPEQPMAPMTDDGQVSPLPVVPSQPVQPRQPVATGYKPMETLPTAPVTSAGPAGSTAAAVSGTARSHVIKSGDTVGHIAKKYGVSVAAVMQANNLDEAKAKRLQIGKSLVIPASSGAVVRKDGKGVAGSAAVKGGSVNADGTYTVQPGDFPGRIARKLGVRESELMKANNLTAESAKRLQVGQKLVVPGKGAKNSAATKPVAAPVQKPVDVKPVDVAPAKTDPLDDVVLKGSETDPGSAVDVAPVDVTQPDASIPADANLNQIPVIVDEDTTIEAFAAKHHITVEKLKELNPGTLPAAGKLTKNLLLMIPGN